MKMNEDEKTVEIDKKDEGTGTVTQTDKKTEGEIEMVSKDEAQKMVDKALAKKLPPKEELDAFKKWKESQKTETEKQAEIQKQLTQREQEATNLKNENLVLKKGVNVDDVDYVLFKVSKMEGDFEENLDGFLKENDKFLKSNSSSDVSEPKDTGVSVNKTDIKKDSGVDAILKAKHPELFK